MDAITLQPAAGAHGEFTGILMVRAYHESKGNARKKIIVPDSAHGTNPATAAVVGTRCEPEVEPAGHGGPCGAGADGRRGYGGADADESFDDRRV